MNTYLQRIWQTTKSKLFADTLSQYALSGVYYLIPLIQTPYLARVYGAETWGILAFIGGFMGYLSVLTDYGFSISGVRDAARCKDELGRLGSLVGGILGAKLLLSLAAILLAWGAWYWVPAFRQHSLLYWLSVAGTLVSGLNLSWFFQGIERIRIIANVDIVLRLASLPSLFFLVRSPDDAWKIAALSLVTSGICVVYSYGLCWRWGAFSRPSLSGSIAVLRAGWLVFLYRGGLSFYTIGNTFLLGLLASPQVVGTYAAAEKIYRALLSLLWPLHTVLFPKISNLAGFSRASAAQLAKKSAMVLGLMGVAIGLLMAIFAPLLTRLLMGPGYDEAVPILRILAFLPALIGLSTVLGTQWMLSLGLDRTFNWITLGTSLINLALACLFVPSLAQFGMAWSLVIAETWALLAICLALNHKRLNPLTVRPSAPSSLESAPSPN